MCRELNEDSAFRILAQLTKEECQMENDTLGEPMPEDVASHLGTLLNYLWCDERKHAAEFEGELGGHIFVSLVVIRNWLDGTNKSVEWYIENA